MTEERRRVLFTLVSANSLPPDIAAPSDNAFSSSLRSSCGSNIEVEDGFACRLVFARVVVDDVSNFLALAVYVS
jgi:hypothetical protein